MRLKKAVYIEWIDSVGDRGWTDLDRNFDLLTVVTIGFLVAETKESVTITASLTDFQAESPLTIPKFAIRKRRVIKLPK